MKAQFLKHMTVRFAVVAVLAALSPGLVWAQTDYEGQVRQQLDEGKAKLQRDGFQRTHTYRTDELVADETGSFRLDLREGWEYLLVGACDADCADIDFRVYDENDNLIGEDTGSDDVPVVKVTPKWTGEFRIEVSMYECGNEPCVYGIGVFGK